MRYRVALDVTQIPRLGAGVSTYVVNLATELARLPKRAFDLIIIAKRADAASFNSSCPTAEVVSVSLRSRPHRLVWEQTGLPMLVARKRIQLLHSPHYSVPFLGNVRRVVTFHDLTYILLPQYHSLSRRWYFRWLIPRAAGRADHILCDSLQTRDDLHEVCPQLPKTRSTHVPLGIAQQYLEPISRERVHAVREKYGLGDNYVLHVGTIEPRKNIETALGAVELLMQDGVELRLVLAGQAGWVSRALQSRLERSPVSRVLGYVSATDLPALYAGSRALVMPSHYEGFGFPVLEAMATGTPVVCSGRGSLGEVAGDVALIPTSDSSEAYAAALRRVFTPGPDRDSRISRGRRWASRFSWRATAEATAAVYDSVMGGDRSPTISQTVVTVRDADR